MWQVGERGGGEGRGGGLKTLSPSLSAVPTNTELYCFLIFESNALNASDYYVGYMVQHDLVVKYFTGSSMKGAVRSTIIITRCPHGNFSYL